jgi:pSer/pThr/pTyr-binding forkhead associated (FHA) protein
MNAKFIARIGEHQGRDVTTEGSKLAFECDPESRIQIRHSWISQHHCPIIYVNGRVSMEGLGSNMGTELDGRSVDFREGRDDDQPFPAPPGYGSREFERPPVSEEPGSSPSASASEELALAATTDDGSKSVRLLARTGTYRGRYIEVNDSRILIGRDPTCHIRGHSDWISRIHTSVERRAGRVFVHDRGSTNGTRLNYRQLRNEEAEVFDGDLLEVGPLEFVVVIPPDSEIPGSGRSDLERPIADDEEDMRSSAAIDPIPPDLLAGISLSCAIQPGAVIHLDTPGDLMREPTLLRAVIRNQSLPVSESPNDRRLPYARPEADASTSLEHVFGEFLRTRGWVGTVPSEPHLTVQDAPKSDPVGSRSAPPSEVIPPETPPTEDEDANFTLWPSDDTPAYGPSDDTPAYGPSDGHKATDLEDHSEPSGPAAPPVASRRINEILSSALKDLPTGFDVDPPAGTDLPSGDDSFDVLAHAPKRRQSGDRNRGVQGRDRTESRNGMKPQVPDPVARNNSRPALAESHKPRKPPRASRPEGPDRVERLVGDWGDLSKEKKLGVGALVVLSLFLTHRFVIDPLLHGSPRTQTVHVLEAVIQNQEKQLVTLTEPSTSSQAVQWLNQVGPIMKRQAQEGARTEVKLMWQRGGEAETMVDVHLNKPAKPAEPAPEPRPSASGSRKTPSRPGARRKEPVAITKLTLFWKRNPGGDWLLVGNAL